jgi:hypothetical protein
MGPLVAKLIYTAILTALTIFFVREIWKVWLDPQVYVGRFEVISDNGKDEEASISFSKRIVSAQAMLVQQMSEYQQRSATVTPTDQTYALPGSLPLSLPPEALEGVEITIQNINIRQIITNIRRAFLAPNEISGYVTIRENSVLATVNWPKAPTLLEKRAALTQFLTPSRPSLQAAAAHIACSLSWARAASVERKFVAISRSQFCDFANALNDLYALRDKASTPTGLGTTDTELVRKHAAQLKLHYGSDSVYPDVYRLRADLLELLPEAARSTGELVDGQEDRVRYAMLSEEFRELSPDVRRMAALAFARPALIIENDKILSPPDNWAGLLRRQEADIKAVSAATGIFTRAGQEPSGTGFIVAPGLVMTTKYVAEYARTRSKSEKDSLKFCLRGVDQDKCLSVGATIYVGGSEDRKIALVEILNHDIAVDPYISFWQPLPTANELTGRYVYVMGFPYYDARMPPEFMDRLLGKIVGRKRLMPGRVLAVGQKTPGGLIEEGLGAPPLITTDISTSGGAGGGPLVDLATGKVIAVSYAGVWQGEKGKFAYAQTPPKEALDLINKRLLGQAGALNPQIP